MNEASRQLSAHVFLDSELDEARVRELVAAGADPNAAQGRHTALRAAAWEAKTELVRFLLAAGADPDAPESVLFMVVDRPEGRYEVLRALIEGGARVDAIDTGWGQTPLMRAVCRADADAIRLLLDAGASCEAKDPEGRTVFEIAVQCGDPAVVALLPGRPPEIEAWLRHPVPDPHVPVLRAALLEALRPGDRKHRTVHGGFKYEYDIIKEIRFEHGEWREVDFDEYLQERSEHSFASDDAVVERLLRDEYWRDGRFPPRDRYVSLLRWVVPRGPDDL